MDGRQPIDTVVSPQTLSLERRHPERKPGSSTDEEAWIPTFAGMTMIASRPS